MKKHEAVSESDLLVYGAYTQIATTLQHHNRLQSTYKTFSSMWLMATFLGIGYTLSSDEVNLPINPLLIVIFICLASVFGIALIWYMDMIVAERLIATAVVQGVDLEKKYEWIPKFYCNVNDMQGLLGYINYKTIFYIGLFAILFGVIAAVVSVLLKQYGHPLWIIIPIILFFLISLGCALLLFYSNKKSNPYKRIERLKGCKIARD